jgi:hypothetical protein
MAAPNIVNVTSILGKTTYATLSTTGATTILSNASGSNKVYKVNCILVANDDGGTAADITITYNTGASGGGSVFHLCRTVSVGADSTLVVLDKASSIYLEEDRSIVATASASNDLDVIISYEEIDDA